MSDVDDADGVLPKPIVAPVAGGMAMLAAAGGPDRETGAVSGRVVDPDGKPVRNFRIRLDVPRKKPQGLKWGGFAAVYSSIGILTTDAAGRFRVTDIDRNRVVRLTASVEGYRDAVIDVVKTVDASGESDFDALTLKLQMPSSLKVDVKNDGGKVQWVLLATNPECEAYTAAHYVQAGGRQVRGQRIRAGKVVFESVEFNDGVLTVVRGKEVAVVPWRGEKTLKADVAALSWVKVD